METQRLAIQERDDKIDGLTNQIHELTDEATARGESHVVEIQRLSEQFFGIFVDRMQQVLCAKRVDHRSRILENVAGEPGESGIHEIQPCSRQIEREDPVNRLASLVESGIVEFRVRIPVA